VGKKEHTKLQPFPLTLSEPETKIDTVVINWHCIARTKQWCFIRCDVSPESTSIHFVTHGAWYITQVYSGKINSRRCWNVLFYSSRATFLT